MVADERVVHVHGGSALLDRLRAAGVPGERLEWCDPVSSGPTPAGLSADDWYRTRARYLTGGGRDLDDAAVERRLRDQDRALLAIPAETDLVIWVGPELFCQAILMRLLVLLPERDRLSLVDPGDQPGNPGCGLGKMPPESLRASFAGRRPVTAAARDLAGRAWTAFTAPTARPLVDLVDEPTPSLPHLLPALRRHLADLPDGATGLSTTENHLLEVLEAGPLRLGALLEAIARREPRPFLTDSLLEGILQRLSATPAPLVSVDTARVSQITQRGRDVLAGHDFWTADRWHAGIHIRPHDDEEEDEGAPTPS